MEERNVNAEKIGKKRKKNVGAHARMPWFPMIF